MLRLCRLESLRPDLSFAAPPAVGQDDAPPLRPVEPIQPEKLEAFVDGVVTAAMAERRIVGVTVSAVQGGQVILSKGYGFADLEAGRRVEPAGTLFRIGSITKTFTWIAIMRLVEAGELSARQARRDGGVRGAMQDHATALQRSRGLRRAASGAARCRLAGGLSDGATPRGSCALHPHGRAG